MLWARLLNLAREALGVRNVRAGEGGDGEGGAIEEGAREGGVEREG